jgi:predicted amidohydrolase YtcJ
MLSAVDGLAESGIGLIHSVTGVGFPGDLDVTLESLFGRGLRNEVAYRVFFQTMEAEKAKKRGLPRIGGCFATALDGCFGSVDAALRDPYSHDAANSGVLYYPDETVRAFATRANRAGPPGRDARHRRPRLRPGRGGARGGAGRFSAAGPSPRDHPRLPPDGARP